MLSLPRRIVSKLSAALALYRGRSDVLLKALLLSCGLQCNVVLHFIIISLALQLTVPPLAMFVIIPVAVLILTLPVSINGIGVREAVLVLLFGSYGVPAEAAIAFAWIWLAMHLGHGLVGGMALLFTQNRRGAARELLDR